MLHVLLHAGFLCIILLLCFFPFLPIDTGQDHVSVKCACAVLILYFDLCGMYVPCGLLALSLSREENQEEVQFFVKKSTLLFPAALLFPLTFENPRYLIKLHLCFINMCFCYPL